MRLTLAALLLTPILANGQILERNYAAMRLSDIAIATNEDGDLVQTWTVEVTLPARKLSLLSDYMEARNVWSRDGGTEVTSTNDAGEVVTSTVYAPRPDEVPTESDNPNQVTRKLSRRFARAILREAYTVLNSRIQGWRVAQAEAAARAEAEEDTGLLTGGAE